MFAVTYMRDKAFQWIQPHLKDVLIKESDDQSQVMNEMFMNFKTFKIHVRRVFEDINTERTAAQKLMNLKQKRAASMYAVWFQKVSFNLSWRNAALTEQFYRGLKKIVKNDIARGEWSTTLQNMIITAIQINNQMYERKLKKHNNKAPIVIREWSEQKEQHISEHYKDYDLQSMNLDMTQRHSKREKGSECFQRKENSSSIKKEKCYNCDVEGHYTNKCRKSKKLQQVARTEKRPKQQKQKLVTVLTVLFSKHKHDCLSWTACYNDMCTMHWSDKDDSEWFSKALRKTQWLQVTEKEKKSQLQVESEEKAYIVSQSLSLKVGQDNEYIVMKLSNSNEEYEMVSSSSDDKLLKNQKTSSSETVNKFYSEIQLMKKEYSSELWNTAYENILETLQKEATSIGYEERISLLRQQITFMNQEIMKVCKFQQAYEECYEIFKEEKSSLFFNFVKQVEWMQGILNSIMHQEEQRYGDIVREYPPIEAQFIKNEGYVTTENSYVSQVMQMKVWAVRQEYVWLDLRTNSKNHVNLIKFEYLEPVEPEAKN